MAINQLQKKLEEKSVEASFKPASTQNLFLFSVNHKTAPVPIREKFAIPDYALAEAVQNLKSYKSLKSFLVLSTCNRTEIYFVTEELTKAEEDIYSFFKSKLGIEKKIVKEYSIFSTSNEVTKHAFKLAAGLDSLVIGESQVLSQVKNAYSLAQKEKTLDFTLELLFQNAIKSAKEIHKKTNLSKNCQSISSAAVDLADTVCGPLKTKSTMVLGAGNMAKLALEHIVKLGGAKETIALNRSPHRVIEFSDKYKIDKTVPFENIYEVLNDIDVLICAAGAPHFIVFAEQFKQVRKDTSKSLFIFDVSLPRNIDSEFGKLDNVKLYDVDTLQEVYNKTNPIKEEDLNKTNEIILNYKNDFLDLLENEAKSTNIKELKESFEKTRQEKLSNLLKNKSSFTREEVDYITKNITNTIFHELLKNVH